MDRRSMVSLSTAALLCLNALCNARADEVLKFPLVMHATSVQPQEVGDVDGHVLGLARLSGLAFFSDGSVGTYIPHEHQRLHQGCWYEFNVLQRDVQRWVGSLV
jgi:hypothetical protein